VLTIPGSLISFAYAGLPGDHLDEGAMSNLITLLTDFGTRDAFVAA